MNEEQLTIFLRKIEKKWIKSVKTMVREIEMELFPDRHPPTPYLNIKLEPSILESSESESESGQAEEDEIEEELTSSDSDKVLSPCLQDNITPCCYSKNFRMAEEENAMNSCTRPNKLQRDDFTPSPINSCKRRVRKILRFSSPDYNYSSLNVTYHSENSFAFSSPEHDSDLVGITNCKDITYEQGNKSLPSDNDVLDDLLVQFALNDMDVWTTANRQYMIDYRPALEAIAEEIPPTTVSLLEYDFNYMYSNSENQILNITF